MGRRAVVNSIVWGPGYVGSLEVDDCCSACDVPSSVSVETPPEAYGQVVSDTVQVFGRGAGEV